MKKYTYYIGIDPGVNTGIAVWYKEKKFFLYLDTIHIHKAMDEIKNYVDYDGAESFFIRVEDARQRKWFGERSNQKQQGAGSVKRDCKIWEDFLTDLGVDFEMVAPKKGMTKLNAAKFKQLTKYEGKTTEHSRDAGMLVYGY